jgi:hypothetical protein
MGFIPPRILGFQFTLFLGGGVMMPEIHDAHRITACQIRKPNISLSNLNIKYLLLFSRDRHIGKKIKTNNQNSKSMSCQGHKT